jgi:hypothetical protein
MTKIHVAVIIVTFNSAKYISKCIRSLIPSKSEGVDLKIVIVDNNSSDGTREIIDSLKTKQCKIVFVKNKTNLGFAKAINIGIKTASRQDYYLLLNPDTELNKTSIINLIKCAKKYSAGIVGGTTYGKNGKRNGSYFRFPTLYVGIFDFTNIRKLDPSDRWHNYFYYLDTKNRESETKEVNVVTGGYMLISSETIAKIGLLDEKYFMYLEDVDYCLRANKEGLKIVHCADSRIIHYSGGSSRNKDRIRHSSWMLSRKYYYLKHFSILGNLIIQPIFLLDDFLILANKYLKQ